MLYDRWRQIAREHRNEVALQDMKSGERWTFSQLANAAEESEVVDPIIFPKGSDFITTLLRAWRSGRIVCPLEADQIPPAFNELPSGCVHLKTTSATTGLARVVAFTEEQIAADADNIVATMGLRADWPNLGVISLAHSYGFSNLALPLLLHGIPLILAEAPLPETVVRAASSVGAVTLAAVPALWSVWHGAGMIPKNIHLAISAGAPLPVSLEQSVFSTHHLKIHNFYGSSECGGIAYDKSDTPRTDACAGTPMKNVRVSVGDDGCLMVQSNAVGKTYWPEPTPQLTAGCFLTSDLGEIRNGAVYLQGRADDQINIAGRKLSPEDIEKVLRLHPKVSECLVFGVPSEEVERTDAIVACVASAADLNGEILRQFLLDKLPAWQIPRDWMIVNSLETNSRGKLSRAECRRKFLSNRNGTTR